MNFEPFQSINRLKPYFTMIVVKAIKLAMNVARFFFLCANLFFSSVVEQIFTH